MTRIRPCNKVWFTTSKQCQMVFGTKDFNSILSYSYILWCYQNSLKKWYHRLQIISNINCGYIFKKRLCKQFNPITFSYKLTIRHIVCLLDDHIIHVLSVYLMIMIELISIFCLVWCFKKNCNKKIICIEN